MIQRNPSIKILMPLLLQRPRPRPCRQHLLQQIRHWRVYLLQTLLLTRCTGECRRQVTWIPLVMRPHLYLHLQPLISMAVVPAEAEHTLTTHLPMKLLLLISGVLWLTTSNHHTCIINRIRNCTQQVMTLPCTSDIPACTIL